MKLATYKDGSRDGQLIVVSRDLSQAHYATGVAHRMQQVLDDWNFLAPQLEDLYTTLNQGKARHAFPFDPTQCLAPLPRAGQYANGLAYPSHVALLYPERASEPADGLLMHQGYGHLMGACDKALFADEAPGIDFESGLAVITGDVPGAAPPEQALDGVRLLMLANGWTLRHRMAQELAQGFGLVQSKPAVAFSPVAVTPDELGDAWADGRVHLTLQTVWNGRTVGLCDAGEGLGFGELVAHLAATRRVRAGSIVGGGAVSNPAVEVEGRDGEPGLARKDWPKGYGCIAEKRAMEALLDGQPTTAYMKFGDTVRIEMKGKDGLSIFGAIEQQVMPRSS